MELPFSREAFLDVFGIYNSWLWPVAGVLWVFTAVAVAAHAMGHARAKPIFGLLGLQWVWAAIAYHAALFSWINPAAWLFAALFLIEGGLLFRYGAMRGRRPLSREHTARERVAYVLIAYGLVYPAIAAAGEAFPRVPTFGVPCPTTIVTAGFLMLVSPHPLSLALIPLLWTVVGGSAAFLLGMPADFGLIAAGIALAVSSWPRRTIDPCHIATRRGEFSAPRVGEILASEGAAGGHRLRSIEAARP